MTWVADLLLSSILRDIEAHDTDYDVRYGLVLQAVHMAHVAGYRAGFGWDFSGDDPDLDGRRVVAYIVLPQGQVSWHMREFTEPWDGHSTEEKYSRINAFAAAAETEKTMTEPTDSIDQAWRDAAEFFRDVLAAANVNVERCLPGEPAACGHGNAQHAASYLGTLKAWVAFKIDHLPAEAQEIAEGIYTLKCAQMAGESDHGRHEKKGS